MKALILLSTLSIALADIPSPGITKHCRCMQDGESFHVKGVSPNNKPDFVIHLLKDAGDFDHGKWGQREGYEAPFHFHVWFHHPFLKPHMDYALGRHAKWDRVDVKPLLVQHNRPFYFRIEKAGNAFKVFLDGRQIYHFNSNRAGGCINAAYVTWTTIHNQFFDRNNCAKPQIRAQLRPQPRPQPRPAPQPVHKPAPKPAPRPPAPQPKSTRVVPRPTLAPAPLPKVVVISPAQDDC